MTKLRTTTTTTPSKKEKVKLFQTLYEGKWDKQMSGFHTGKQGRLGMMSLPNSIDECQIYWGGGTACCRDASEQGARDSAIWNRPAEPAPRAACGPPCGQPHCPAPAPPSQLQQLDPALPSPQARQGRGG